MSVYFVKGKGKGWRYDFTLKGIRHTETWFKTKAKAKEAEAKQREKLKNPKMPTPAEQIPIDMDFLELVNKRLDHVKAYNSERHYTDHIYMAKRWIKEWGQLFCTEITPERIQNFLLNRLQKTSGYTANKDLRMLRALFNFAMHPTREWMSFNPTRGIEFFPVEKRIKYVPPKKDVLQVILTADPDTQDYLWTIAKTMGRMGEVNRLTWRDIIFDARCVTLYTRKKKGGHLTPRSVPMTDKLFEVLTRRFENRDAEKPWVFWHRYWSQKNGRWIEGPYAERKKIMKTLCKKAGVRYFRYHALRHYGASMLDSAKISIGSIQRILGHESRITTEIYLHSVGEGERHAMDVLNAGFCEVSHTDSHTDEKRG
jgi:integrase